MNYFTNSLFYLRINFTVGTRVYQEKLKRISWWLVEIHMWFIGTDVLLLDVSMNWRGWGSTNTLKQDIRAHFLVQKTRGLYIPI